MDAGPHNHTADTLQHRSLCVPRKQLTASHRCPELVTSFTCCRSLFRPHIPPLARDFAKGLRQRYHFMQMVLRPTLLQEQNDSFTSFPSLLSTLSRGWPTNAHAAMPFCAGGAAAGFAISTPAGFAACPTGAETAAATAAAVSAVCCCGSMGRARCV